MLFIDNNFLLTYTKDMVDTQLAALRKKEGRGIFLTIILILHSLFALFITCFLIWALVTSISDLQMISKFILVSSSYVLLGSLFSIIIFLLTIIAAFFLWKWKKIGVYALAALFVVWLTEYFLYYFPKDMAVSYTKGINPFIAFITVSWFYFLYSLLYFWAIKRKWHLFT